MPKRVALVTGVSSGIGLATVRLLAQRGWVVIGTTRDGKPVPDLSGVAVDIQTAEMAEPAALEALVERVVGTYGRLDALILNAGYGRLALIEDITPDQMKDQLLVNTVAPVILIRAALPTMRRQNGGVIIGLSSIAGRIGYRKQSLYSASKFGLEGMFESLHYELPPSIKLRLIEPGPVATPFWQDVPQPANSISPKQVAEVIVKAAESTGRQLHYPIGVVRWALIAKWLLPGPWFRALIARAGSNNADTT